MQQTKRCKTNPVSHVHLHWSLLHKPYERVQKCAYDWREERLMLAKAREQFSNGISVVDWISDGWAPALRLVSSTFEDSLLITALQLENYDLVRHCVEQDDLGNPTVRLVDVGDFFMGRTPIMGLLDECAFNCHRAKDQWHARRPQVFRAVRLMVDELGADTNLIQSRSGHSALHKALNMNWVDMAIYLRRKGAIVGSYDRFGEAQPYMELSAMGMVTAAATIDPRAAFHRLAVVRYTSSSRAPVMNLPTEDIYLLILGFLM
jgi:hypothetical protein